MIAFRQILLICTLALLAICAALFSLLSGSVELTLADLFRLPTATQSELATQIIFDIRLPRTASAFVVGGLLSLAGVIMQVLLRNPLADPYILGVSGGAAVGALSASLLGAC
ncbi:MAG TPA: ABC transporter permease, partial [Gammaproteobacteria bacterium]|nr:ABC transporter permease [Gammaproteobacteria bacterium]